MDREKVIKTLEYCASTGVCRLCDYWSDELDDDTCCQISKEALALLEEQQTLLKEQQKPVKPNRLLNKKIVSYNSVVYQYSCGNCSTLLRNSWKACPLCGKMVKWDD